MKILLFRTDPSIMSVKNYNSQEIGLAKAYIALGHQCDIVYYNGKNPSRVDEIRVNQENVIHLYWVKGYSVLNNGIFPGLNKIIKSYDIIQVSEYYQFTSWYIYQHYGRTKKVYIYQGVYDADNSRRYYLRCKVMDPILLNNRVLTETQIFTKSNLALDSMKKRGFKNVKTVGVGLDVSRFNGGEVASVWADELKRQKGDSLYLLYIGILEDRRNILFMLDILKYVVRKMPNVKMVLVGKGQPDYVNSCIEKINELQIKEYIVYKDGLPQQELTAVYHCSDLFLLPTKYEIFGMVLLEAMMFGVPVISSFNGGSSTIIKDNVNGCIVNDFSIESWGNATIELLQNSEKRKSIIEAAMKTSAADFTWNRIAGTMLNCLGQ